MDYIAWKYINCIIYLSSIISDLIDFNREAIEVQFYRLLFTKLQFEQYIEK